MAFQFSQTGTKEALGTALNAAKEDGNHFASFRQAVIDDLEKLDPKFNGAHLDIVSHDNGQARMFQVNIIGKNLAV